MSKVQKMKAKRKLKKGQMVSPKDVVDITWGPGAFPPLPTPCLVCGKEHSKPVTRENAEDLARLALESIRKRKDEMAEESLRLAAGPGGVASGDAINHPDYYGGDTTYEVIKVLEAWGLDKDAHLFNTVKYIARAGKKDPAKEVQDLEKGLFYLKRKITVLKAAQQKNAEGAR